METIEYYTDKYPAIPVSTIEAIINYIQNGYIPGGFVTAVLQNNLKEAIGRADQFNQQCLRDIVMFICWEIPANTHGSPEIVRRYLAKPANEKDNG